MTFWNHQDQILGPKKAKFGQKKVQQSLYFEGNSWWIFLRVLRSRHPKGICWSYFVTLFSIFHYHIGLTQGQIRSSIRPKRPRSVKKVRWQVWHINLGCLWAQKSNQAFWSSSDQKTNVKMGQKGQICPLQGQKLKALKIWHINPGCILLRLKEGRSILKEKAKFMFSAVLTYSFIKPMQS